MRDFLRLFLFIVLLTAASPLFGERIVVWNLSPQSGVTEKESSTVTAILIGEIARISKMDVISEKEIKSAIMTEETRKSCIADDNSCMQYVSDEGESSMKKIDNCHRCSYSVSGT
jgi:BRCT domain type II-containing protein